MKPTLHPSPFALDIFITPPHHNSRHARDHKKNKVKTYDVPKKPKPSKGS